MSAELDMIRQQRRAVWAAVYAEMLPRAVDQGYSLDSAANLARKHANEAVDQFNARFGLSYVKE